MTDHDHDHDEDKTLANLMVIKLPALSASLIESLRSECGMLDSAMRFLTQCRSHPQPGEGDDDSFDVEETLRSAHFALAGVRERLAFLLSEQHPGAMIATDRLKSTQGTTITKGKPIGLAKDGLKQILDVQRRQIAKAMSIIEACRMGSDSMLAPLQDEGEDEGNEPNFDGAFTVASDIIDVVKITLRAISTAAR